VFCGEIRKSEKKYYMGILKSCKPRKEVLKGDLDDAIFAADFGDLIADKAPKVYGDAKKVRNGISP